MAGLFDRKGKTSSHNLLAAHAYFRKHPDGQIATGIWTCGTWRAKDFHRHLRKGIHARCGRGLPSNGWHKMQDEYQSALRCDARLIRLALHDRAIMRGRNILQTPEMARRFPDIHNPPEEGF